MCIRDRVYETAVNQYAPLTNESFITNTVTASGDGITSITAKETVNAEALPLLGITKSISPVPVTENGRDVYKRQEDRYAKMVSSFQMSNPPAVPSRSGPVDAPDIPSFRFDQDATLFLYTMDLHIFSTACMSILKSQSVVPAAFFPAAYFHFVLSYLHSPHGPSDIL